MHPAGRSHRPSDEIPEALVDRMRELGLFGHSIPEAYGGAGLTTEELARVNIEVSQGATTFRARFGGNTGIASESLVVDGTPEQRQRWLPLLASGELTGCFALTEPEAGSDATALTTTAVRDGRQLPHHRAQVLHHQRADCGPVHRVCAHRPQGKGAAGITAFLVERGTPGLSTPPAYRKLGQHGSPVGEVVLQEVRVPASAIVGGEANLGQGFRTAMRALNKQRINLAGLCVGPAIRLVDEMVRRARHAPAVRPAGGRLPAGAADDCPEQHRGARRPRPGAGDRAQARRRAGRDHGSVHVQAVCQSEMCGRVADSAVQVFGGGGYIADNVAERFYRDVRLFRLYEGTSQIHLVNIAKRTVAQVQAQMKADGG
jgi:acyl-CoA dehydrogenase